MKDAPEDANRIRNGVNHRKNDWDGIPGATPVSQGEYVFTRILTLTDRELMIQSDKLAYLTDLSGSRGRTSGETALSTHSEEHEVF